MFKTIITLFRGATHDAEEAFSDRHALAILNQQMRDSAVAVEQARKAVAIAMAQNRQEADQFDRLVARIADLEARTIAAIEQEKEDLAREAAETIALLEAERDARIRRHVAGAQACQPVFTYSRLRRANQRRLQPLALLLAFASH